MLSSSRATACRSGSRSRGTGSRCSRPPAVWRPRSRRFAGTRCGSAGPAPWFPSRCSRRLASSSQKRNLVPIFLSADEEEDFYGRVCNDTLWPLFHYFSDRLRITPEAWQHYVRVNERFADAILEHSGPDSRVWIHDFHLMLVPAMLRRRAPRLSVGFFLHTPFPSSEIYRLLPAREEVLRGLLGADYVSFQVGDYARHFRSSCLRIIGIDSRPDAIEVDGRTVGIGVDPIGIDVAGFRATLEDPETGAAPRPARGAVRRTQARARSRAARLLEGDPAQAARLRTAPRAGSHAGRDDDDAAGARAVAPREPRVPPAAGRDRAPDRPHQRPLRTTRDHAGRVPPPRHLEGGARRALPPGRRHAGDAAPGRDEPRRARVRPLPGGARPSGALAWLAAPLGARRRGSGSARGHARQPVERRRRGRGAGDGAPARSARASPQAGDHGQARRGARQPKVG